MGWKEDNRGAGPWPFVAQPNKWGYLNNPNWMIPPNTPVSYDGREDEEPQIWDYESGSPIANKTSDPMHTHIPCGHWHKPVSGVTPPVIYDVNLFRLTNRGTYGSIQSIFFNTTIKTLSFAAYYNGSPGVGGIEVIGDRVYTINGRYDISQLLELDRFLSVTNTYSIFNYWDCTGPLEYELAYHNGFLYWVSVYTNLPSVIGKIAVPSFTRISRFSPGAVFYGSDGNLWQYDSVYSILWGIPLTYPITGGSYDVPNNIIADNDHSGPIIAWGSGIQGISVGSTRSVSVGGGVIYYGASASPISRLYAYRTSDYSLINVVNPPSPNYARTVFRSSNGYVYCASGTFDLFNIARYDANLGAINNVTYSGHGRVTTLHNICDLGSYIVVGTSAYAGDYGIYILNADLSLFNFVSTRDLGHDGCDSIISYDNFLFVGENKNISAFEFVGGSLVLLDRIYIDYLTVGSYSKDLRHMLIPR